MSYSHADEKIARWLHNRLEAYTIPKSLRDGDGEARRRIGRIFRDREEFAAGGELKAEIESALGRSVALIVLCSLTAKASRYVDAEIRYFKQHNPTGLVIPVIVSGTAPDCFPAALREDGERLGADLKPEADGRDVGSLKVLAGLLGVGLDVLIQRETVARRHRLQVGAAFTSAFVVLALLSVGFGTLAYKNVQRAREIHAERLAEETDFLVNQAWAAHDRGDSSAAVGYALQALPVDFRNPERPFSLDALAALQGAIFDSTLISRAKPTKSAIVSAALLDEIGVAIAATANGEVLEYRLPDLDSAKTLGRCSGTPKTLQISSRGDLAVLGTDRSTCIWHMTKTGAENVASSSVHGPTSVQDDRILVGDGDLLNVFSMASNQWTIVRPNDIPTPTPARYAGGGVLAFDQGNRFHLIDAVTRRNLAVGCLGGSGCPSSVAAFNGVAMNAARTKFAIYSQGRAYLDLYSVTNCTTIDTVYSGTCEGHAGRVTANGPNTAAVLFSDGPYPTFVREEFGQGAEAGNASTLSVYDRLDGTQRSRFSLSRDGRFLARYEAGEASEAGGVGVGIRDLLGPADFAALSVHGGARSIDLGWNARLALVVDRNGVLTLHRPLGRTMRQELRLPSSIAEAIDGYFGNSEAFGIQFGRALRVFSTDDFALFHDIDLRGGELIGTRFEFADTGCALSTLELICIERGKETRIAVPADQTDDMLGRSPDGTSVVLHRKGRIEYYTTKPLRLLWSSPALAGDICCTTYGPSSDVLLVSYKDGRWQGLRAADGVTRYTIGAGPNGPHSRLAISADKTRFLTHLSGINYAIVDTQSGRQVKTFIIPAPRGVEVREQEIAIAPDFSRLWYVARSGQGIIYDLGSDRIQTVPIDGKFLEEAVAEFSPTGHFLVRSSYDQFGAGAMVMPEAMQIVDVGRGEAFPVAEGQWAPVITNGMLDTDAVLTRSYSFGRTSIVTPSFADGTGAIEGTGQMYVPMDPEHAPAALGFIAMASGRATGEEPIEYSLQVTALAMSHSRQRLVMMAADDATNEFVLRAYEIPHSCEQLRAEGEAILGYRPSPPHVESAGAGKTGWMEALMSAVLGRQHFPPASCPKEPAPHLGRSFSLGPAPALSRPSAGALAAAAYDADSILDASVRAAVKQARMAKERGEKAAKLAVQAEKRAEEAAVRARQSAADTFSYQAAGNAKYEGDEHAGVADGYGVYTFANGASFAGQITRGAYGPVGVYRTPASKYQTRYEGSFSNNKETGDGVIIGASGADTVRYAGQLVDGRPDGYGVLDRSCHCRYEGRFKDYNYEGYGIDWRGDGQPDAIGFWTRGKLTTRSR